MVMKDFVPINQILDPSLKVRSPNVEMLPFTLKDALPEVRKNNDRNGFIQTLQFYKNLGAGSRILLPIYVQSFLKLIRRFQKLKSACLTFCV